MFNYRVKSTKVEAFIFSDATKFPDWFSDAIADGVVEYEFGMVTVKNNNSHTTVRNGDYIVKMPNGTIHPCPKYIFEAYYEQDR